MISHTTIEGFAAVVADTGPLRLTLLSELGGKISGLYDQRSGREWLWRHPRMAYRRAPHGSSYTALADSGGWDECFPSVAPCPYPADPWRGAPIQDHGELWSQAAALEIVEAGEQLRLQTRWQGVVLPYTFERSIILQSGSSLLRFEYQVRNPADAPLFFIWCAHPLLALEPGMQLELPPAARFHLWAAMPPDLLAQTGELRFPDLPLPAHQQAAISRLEACGLALKLWSDPLHEGRAALRAADGALQLRWDVHLLPQLALWLNLGAWAGDGGAPYYNLGLEPCIGAQDSLAEAVTERALFATVPPRGMAAWWLELSLIS